MTNAAGFTVEMATQILTNERYTIRFEDFCIQLFKDAKTVDYLSTSRTYDLGRDARGVTSPGSNVPPVLCCGTDADPVAKADSDLDTLLKHLVPDDVIFCFTDPHFSESKHAKIIANAHRRCSSLKVVEAYGGRQLAELSVQYPDSFEKHYAAELADYRISLALPATPDRTIELTGLRIALTTQLHTAAQQTRKDLIRNLVLTCLLEFQNLTPIKIARRLTERLHLGRTMSELWLLPELNALESSGAVSQTDGTYKLEDKGREELNRRSDMGALALGKGQHQIRASLESNLGYQLTSEEFRLTWQLIEGGIVSLFISHGSEIVESIAAVIDSTTVTPHHESLRDKIHLVAQRLCAGESSGDRQKELALAVEDIFRDRSSPGFEWLCNVASVFLQLCALGLNPSAQKEITGRIQEIEIFLDTDIALSLLCSCEANHSALEKMLRTWKSLGGTLYVTDSVLEEIAHHAWNAQYEFVNSGGVLKSLTPKDAHHVLSNVFVRCFWHESYQRDQECSNVRWSEFIKAFRGRGNHDWNKLKGLLEDYGVEYLSDRLTGDALKRSQKLAHDLFAERKDKTNAVSLAALQEKCDRDARLAIFLAIRSEQIVTNHRSAIAVSSSNALRAAVQIVRQSTVDIENVWYAAAIGWLLSQVPGANMTAKCLQGVMLDVDFPMRFDPLTQASLRILYQSKQWEMHFSRRSTLVDAVRTQIKKRAQDEGIEESLVSEAFIKIDPAKVERNQEILLAAVDSVMVSAQEKNEAALKAEIAKLKEENARLRLQRQTKR